MFRRLNVADDVEFVKGLFQQTLPAAPISRIAVLHIDGDWYEKRESLPGQLVRQGCSGRRDSVGRLRILEGRTQGRRRVLDQRGIQTPLHRLDYSGRFFITSELNRRVAVQ